ncbi:penicillin-insensitive murein endopeptidase [Paucibacter sp. M5-1]|uniref:penicillin-insensitive murein endopeptidase n=1 Tax=Paucibacter sp. M5-1 TaxID=3015998 RepID=UPI003F80BC17
MFLSPGFFSLAAYALIGALISIQPAHADVSRCYGTVAKGRLEGGVKLPTDGANFSAYSKLAVAAGRTYVHAKVADVIVASYATLQARTPGVHYVYGETGWAAGGSFKPHRTHQNGLSVDFFVPVRDAQGRSGPLPTSPLTRFGYDLEFDAEARHGEHRIDFPALAEHLYALHHAARAQGVGIARVIFDTAYLPALFATPRGPSLRQHLPFMKGKPWVRHDEHYHVDFALACRPDDRGPASGRTRTG